MRDQLQQEIVRGKRPDVEPDRAHEEATGQAHDDAILDQGAHASLATRSPFVGQCVAPAVMHVTAMFNPKELSVDKAVAWTRTAGSSADPPALEFTGAEGRSMSFELMFDTYESGTDVHATYVANLLKLAMIQDPNGAEDKKRPPKVAVRWGTLKLPEFQGVIESIGVKYTMFLHDGTPVRATCRVAIREASKLSVGKP